VIDDNILLLDNFLLVGICFISDGILSAKMHSRNILLQSRTKGGLFCFDPFV